MSSKNVVIILALVLLLVGGYLFVRSKNKPQVVENPAVSDSMNQTEPSTEPVASDSAMKKEGQNITIDANGFSPKNVTIKVGESVTWVNKDTDEHQVNSAVHPTHQVYPPLNTIGSLKSGQQRSLSFPEKGVFKFHDHLNPQFFGAVTVE